MTYDNVKKAAKALIDYTGPEARLNDLTNAVKAHVLNSHSWERFLATEDVAYTAGAAFVELDTNPYRKIYRVMALKVQDSDYEPPEYVTPREYYRLLAANWDVQTSISYWTQMNTKLYLLGQPTAALTLNIIYMRNPEQVGWGEIKEDFLDFASVVLARMVTPVNTQSADGRIFANPAFGALKALEKDARHELIQIEYRQPGRDYKVQPDELVTTRREQYDY